MRIIQIHNQYVHLGGEDVVVEREKNLLEKAGHEVKQFLVSNNDINGIGDKLQTAFNLPYSVKYKKHVKQFLKENPADVVHVHNFLPVLTPSIFYACKDLGYPVVATIHNYRLLCVNGLLYRQNKVCEDCVPKKIPVDGIIHGCYQDSKIASVFPAASNGLHNLLGTWNNKIDKIIFLSSFSRAVFQRSALDFNAEKTTIKPNFVEDRGYSYTKEDYFLFVGRLSEEKGIDTVLEAFKKSGKRLIIAGEGPLEKEVEEASVKFTNIEFKRFQNQEQLAALYKNAKALIFASKLYEGLPLVIIEAFSCGTPVLVPDIGNAGELIVEGKNGLKYEPNNPVSLNEVVENFEKIQNQQFNIEARKTFEAKFTQEENLKLLMEIYNEVVGKSKRKRS